MALHPPIRDRKPSEDGFILLAVLILLALFLIAMAAAAPRIAADIQRDRDVETMHRGKQYVRAIQLYYRKFHAYPPNLDALVKTNNIRFLRKKYIDPTTGKADWKPIMMCQNKTPMAMGFFGQPLGAASGCGVVGGAIPGGGTGLPGNPLQGGAGTTGTTGSIFSNSPTGGGSIFSNPTTGGGTGTTPTGTSGAGTGDQSGTGSSGGTDANGNPTEGQTTFGGGGIVGVSPASPKKSIYVFKKKDHYNQWEFLYSPLQDMQQQMGAGRPAWRRRRSARHRPTWHRVWWPESRRLRLGRQWRHNTNTADADAIAQSAIALPPELASISCGNVENSAQIKIRRAQESH